MLSKLEFFERGGTISSDAAELRSLRTAIERGLRAEDRAAAVIAHAGGTLGVCFKIQGSDATHFLKTHSNNERARETLTKEADILAHLYGASIVLELMEVHLEDGSSRLCVLMPELAELAANLSADDACEMIRGYSERLAHFATGDRRSVWAFEHYLVHADRAVGALRDGGFVSKDTATALDGHIDLLRSMHLDLPRTLCHGDLGPKNIMGFQERLVAIDWEDAFWGPAGYDYLYWLTFMQNRSLLHAAPFGRTGLDRNVEHAILALVVLLKSYLSVRSGAHARNILPINERIAEVLALGRE